MRVLSHSLVLEHYEGVNGLHTTSCWEDQQGIDVQFGQTCHRAARQMGDVDQGLRQRLNVRRPSTESVQHAGPLTSDSIVYASAWVIGQRRRATSL